MSTYSIGQPPVDALKLQDFQAVLNILPDNTQKLIAPKDVRDSLYTVWENVAFKPTKVASSSVEYIGIDQDSLREKIFIGKKKVEGLDIMNPTLLGSDVDVFFYNNKEEPQSSYNTKISILAGTTSFEFAPYLESAVVTSDLGNYLNLEIINPSYIVDGSQLSGGDINIRSSNGYVSLNGLVFPKVSENADTTNNGKFLQYNLDGSTNTAYAVWADSFSVDSISASGTVSITGSPVLINGLDINFTDSNPVPTSVGGILSGETFNNVPLTEMFRKLLYPYLAPNVSINFEYSIIESGAPVTPKLFYTITKPGTYSLTNLALNPANINLSNPFPDYSTIDQTGANGFVYPTLTNQQLRVDVGSGYKTNTFTLSITDEYPTTKTSTTSFDVVLPWYYGTSATFSSSRSVINGILGVSSTPTLGKLTPLLKSAPTTGETVELNLSTAGLGSPLGQGCIYFGYPSSYGDINDILDQTDYSIFSFFTQYIVSGVNSPNSYWPNREYKFYIYTGNSGTPTLTTVPVGAKYKLIFQ